MSNAELNGIIEWCRKKMREEREKPYGFSGKRLEGYDAAMKAVMSYLHSLKGEGNEQRNSD